MKNGAIYEFDAPELGKYDITKSYLIEMSLSYRKCNFKSIKSRLRVSFLILNQLNNQIHK